jgi:hypothetical protein
MEMVLDPKGSIRCLYGEALDLSSLGELRIQHASHGKAAGAHWYADLSPVGGPKLGPLCGRSHNSSNWTTDPCCAIPHALETTDPFHVLTTSSLSPKESANDCSVTRRAPVPD